MNREQQIEHGEAIEQAIDDIIEIVLSDSHVEHDDNDGTPVSAETWLEVKAKILALLSLEHSGGMYE